MSHLNTVFLTGGGGYVGAVLVPTLLEKEYRVKVLDLFIYGEEVLDQVRNHPNLQIIKGDLRDQELLRRHLPGCDAVIHLACISNDPSFELNPDLGRSINLDAIGATVSNRLVLGKGAIIGAGAVVVRDMPAFATAIGVPARAIKLRPNDFDIGASACHI